VHLSGVITGNRPCAFHSPGDATPKYDRFDAAGRLVGQVTLRPRSRVVGFGAGTVYVVRTDEDDLQYLERYRR
jgi:hypothetical protein